MESKVGSSPTRAFSAGLLSTSLGYNRVVSGPFPSTFEPDALLGSVVDGRYRLMAHLATGGMGAVFRAEHVYMRKELALKVLRPELSSSADIAERFRREAEIAASLEHENIVRVTDFGKSPDGYLFLAMELLEGEGLFDRLRRIGIMPVQEALGFLIQICTGLEVAHARAVVHRDLKPENIFLCAGATNASGRTLLKILDFGIAKITDPAVHSDTQSGMVVGTPEYLSPEQALGAEVDTRADIYSLGLIAWRMLGGRHPFRAANARALVMMQASQPVPPLTEVRPDLADQVVLLRAVARACAKAVEERHQTIGELRSELESCLDQPARSPTFLGQQPAISGTLPASSPFPGSWAGEPRSRSRETPLVSLSGSPLPATQVSGPVSSAAPVRSRWTFRRWAALTVALIGVGALAGGVVTATVHLRGRTEVRARALLAAGKGEAARVLLEPALKKYPQDEALRVLLGHALHLAGTAANQPERGVELYEEVFARDPNALDGTVLKDLAGDLGRERRVAERAGRLLVRIGARARPAVLETAVGGTGMARFRALELAGELGSGGPIDNVVAYSALLSDPDCDVRKLAARRLGDFGKPAALPRLRELAQSKREVRGFLGFPQQLPACGALEAASSVRRIEAAPSSPPRRR
jgi:serine/threonine-protein kinase